MPRRKKNTPKVFNWKSKIRSAARQIWFWSPMRTEAIRNATKVKGYVDCANCGNRMKKVSSNPPYEVDHLVPASEVAASIRSFDNWFERLFIPANEGLQILCKDTCHAEKTKKENEQRRRVIPLGRIPSKKKRPNKSNSKR